MPHVAPRAPQAVQGVPKPAPGEALFHEPPPPLTEIKAPATGLDTLRATRAPTIELPSVREARFRRHRIRRIRWKGVHVYGGCP